MPNDDKTRFEGLIPAEPSKDDTLFDTLFFEAAARHLSEQNIYPSNEDLKKEITFSPEFEARMEAKMKQWEKEARRSRHRGRTAAYLFRAASIIIAVFIVFGLFVVTSSAARNRVFNFFKRFTEVSTDISFSETPAHGEDLVLVVPEGVYRPEYLPNGFVLESISQLNNITELLYLHEDQAIQVFTCTTASSTTLNLENAEITEFQCLGASATQIETPHDVTIYFEKDNVFIKLYANIPAAELVKVAKSLVK